MTTVIVGCGTIGLAMGAARSARGEDVFLHDVNMHRLHDIASLRISTREPGLLDAVRTGIEGGTIRIAREIATRSKPTNFIICVPTSADDLQNITDTVFSIATVAKHNDAILIRSTVPIGFLQQIQALLASRHAKQLLFSSTPDRSVEGQSFTDQFEVPHLVGADDLHGKTRAMELLGRLGRVIDVGRSQDAEAAKLFCNCWRMTTFAAVNAMSLVASDHGVDLHGLLSRAGDEYPRFKLPRPGVVGGPCLPKDLLMLIQTERDHSVAFFQGVRRSELELRSRVEEIAASHLRTSRQYPRKAAFIGLSFKGSPTVADFRGSPAVELAQSLRLTFPDLVVSGWEPGAPPVDALGVAITSCIADAAAGSTLLVLGHDHPDVIGQDIDLLLEQMHPDSLVMDITGLCRPPVRRRTRNNYWALGRSQEQV